MGRERRKREHALPRFPFHCYTNPTQKALGHKRIETTARHYVLDELAGGLTDGLY